MLVDSCVIASAMSSSSAAYGKPRRGPSSAAARSVARHDDLLEAVHQAGQAAHHGVAGDEAGIGVGHDLVLVHVAASEADDLARSGGLEQALELLHDGRVG